MRASRGRVEVPLSVREVDWGPSRERGLVVDVCGAAVGVVVDVGGGCDGVSVSAMVGGIGERITSSCVVCLSVSRRSINCVHECRRMKLSER